MNTCYSLNEFGPPLYRANSNTFKMKQNEGDLRVDVTLNRVSLTSHNFSSVGPIMMIFWFSESLARGLSDDALKLFFWPVFETIPWDFS